MGGGWRDPWGGLLGHMEEAGAPNLPHSYAPVLPLHLTSKDGLCQNGPKLYGGVLCWRPEGVRDTLLRADQGEQGVVEGKRTGRVLKRTRDPESSRPREATCRQCCQDYYPAHELQKLSYC